MRPLNKLSRDTKLTDQPENTYVYGKNGIWTGNANALQNERGFLPSSSVIPYTVIGCIETDSNFVVFSTDGTYSAIGIYNEETDLYEPRIDDKNLGYKLNFSLNRAIKGEARRNYRGQLEIGWLEMYNGNPIRFANLEDTIPTSLNNYLLFPEYSLPNVAVEVVQGGVLPMGSYFVVARYTNEDGTETRYGTPSSPVFTTAVNFAAVPGLPTGKALKIELTKLDVNYSKVQLSIIKRVKGVTTAIVLPAVPINGATATITSIYTGVEGEDISLEEVIVPAAYYKNAGAITQLNDVLYLADLQEAQVLNLQKYANQIKVKWKSEFISNLDASDDVKSGKLRTFRHGEVYALFIVYKLKGGQVTDAFHIPGPAPLDSHLLQDPLATAEGVTAKRYQTDTVGMNNIDLVNKTGDTGVWVNSTEKYPLGDKYEYFENLRGKNVRHHKMPTVNWMANNLYANNPDYGSKGLDVIGLYLENVIVPPELTGIVEGYELYYAQRDYANSTIISQGLAIHTATAPLVYDSSGRLLTPFITEQYFTGGNYNSEMIRSDFEGSDNTDRLRRTLAINTSRFKLHHPDLMVNKPSLTPSFMLSNYRLRATLGRSTWITDTVDQLNFIVDYATRSSILSKTYGIYGVKNTGYILNNSTLHGIINTKSEDGYAGEFTATTPSIGVSSLAHGGRATEGNSYAPDFEEAHIMEVVTSRSDLYVTFNTQDLVRTGYEFKIGEAPKAIYGGDCFLVYHSYFSTGMVSSPDRFTSQPGDVDEIYRSKAKDTYTDEFYYGTAGNKVIRRYATISTINMWQRYVDPANTSSKFWPAEGSKITDNLDRNKDNNTIAISKEANSIGNLLNGIKTFDYEQVNITQSPYKIIRSNKQAKEGKLNSWKNYNALDYYETDKSFGKIMNLQGYGDKLIIHHKNALFITVDKTTLQGDVLSVVLGTGDIFKFPPVQGRVSKTGYAGTQHPLACVLTDFGYTFPDAETGTIFNFNEKGLNELNPGLSNFLWHYLNTKETNPYRGNGITIGYDRKYHRMLFTIKNIKGTLNTSFTLSYDIQDTKWAFYHDYFPDFYMHTRKSIFNFKNSKIFKMNAGEYGRYHEEDKRYPFFIDAVFKGKESVILNTIVWETEVNYDDNTKNSNVALYDETISALTIWNNYQCSGRIPLTKEILITDNPNLKNVWQKWSFNEFRDLVKVEGVEFLQDLFSDFKVIGNNIEPNMPWYDQGLFKGDFFVVRFEYSNNQNKQITLHNIDVNTSKAY